MLQIITYYLIYNSKVTSTFLPFYLKDSITNTLVLLMVMILLMSTFSALVYLLCALIEIHTKDK